MLKVKKWLSSDYDDLTKFKIKYLMSHDLDELKDCFYKNLDFGTGGIRGIMGVGTNRINKYTVGMLSYGLAIFLKNNNIINNSSVVVAYDVRNNSKYLALIIANVLLNNDVKVYFFNSFKSTPELSYYVNFLKCSAGVMVTGSHNSKEYNGCKIYNYDGSQMVFPQDVKLLNIINNIMNNDKLIINYINNPNIIYLMDSKLRLYFINDCIKYSTFRKRVNREILNIIFTPLHGTAAYLMPDIFYKFGFKNIYLVNEQMKIDSNFSTVNTPNPEDQNTFKLAIKECYRRNADIILSTDCDADRIGVAIRNHNNDIIVLNGNEINTIFVYYILNFLKKNNKLNNKSFIVSTIVSSDIFLKIADKFNIRCYFSLTGFKWIVKLVKQLKSDGFTFIAGGEESFGFMIGDFIKDKNSFTSMLLMAEIASYYKSKNISLYAQLIHIYRSIGFYKDYNHALFFHGSKGYLKMMNIMNKLRDNPLSYSFKYQIESIEDYYTGYKYFMNSTKKEKMSLPQSNILIYRFVNGSKICIRPSGTESKIKLYFSVFHVFDKDIEFNEISRFLTKKIKIIFNNFIYIINLL